MNHGAGWSARRSLMRVAAWALLAMVATEAAIVAFVVLWSPAQAAHTLRGRVQVWDGNESLVHLSYQWSRWVGAADEFPIGSTTHFKPKEHPGFYLVRLTDGTFVA